MFKAGDKVRRIKEFSAWVGYGMKRDGVYTVQRLDSDGNPVILESNDGAWHKGYFEKASRLITEL